MEAISKPFPWESWRDILPPEKRRLGLIVLLVFGAHIAAFFGVRIVYPERLEPHPVTVQVSLLNANGNSTASQDFRFWGQLQDPSMIMLDRGPIVDPQQKQVDLKPIFDSDQGGLPTALAIMSDVDFLPAGLQPLNQRAAESLAPALQTYEPALSTTPGAQRASQVEFDPSIRGRLNGSLPALPSPTASLLSEAGLTVIRLGIDGQGNVVHLLVEESCGKSSIDDQAIAFLRSVRFLPDTADLAWGKATFYWNFQADKAANKAAGGSE